MAFTLRAACISNMGKRRRNHEDNFFFDGECLEEQNHGTEAPLFFKQPLMAGQCLCVFDGMGGENYGESAAYAAAERLKEFIRKPKEFFLSDTKYLLRMIDQLNAAVVSRAKELLTDRMGTTMAGLYFTGRQVYCCNVGDSRVYRLRGNTLTQLSVDHVSKRPLGPGRKAPLTQHLGMDPEEILMEPSIRKENLRSGDQFLISSDGLTDMVEEAVMAEILQEAPNVQEAVEKLVNTALENGGKDNVTVIVCRVW